MKGQTGGWQMKRAHAARVPMDSKSRRENDFLPRVHRTVLAWCKCAARIEPPGPAGACHRACQRPDPLGRPDDKLSEIRGRPPTGQCRPRVSLALNPGYDADDNEIKHEEWGGADVVHGTQDCFDRRRRCRTA